jgi:type IV pilus assembly protein PilF
MRFFPALLALLLAAACSSQSTSESRTPDNSRAPYESGGADARRRAEVHASLAGEYYSRGNYAVALSETRLAIKDDPTYMSSYNMQGLVFMELREDVQARQAFDTALRMQPNSAEVLNNFGWFLCTRGDSGRALELLQRALGDSLYPTPEKVLVSTGLCYRRMGRSAEAEDYLRRAVQIRPEMIGALYNLAIITYERGAAQDAENYLNRYMRLAQPNLDGLVLGVKVARLKKDREAEDSYMQQLRRRFPDAPQVRELTEKPQ